jgi:hypothetical protein
VNTDIDCSQDRAGCEAEKTRLQGLGVPACCFSSAGTVAFQWETGVLKTVGDADGDRFFDLCDNCPMVTNTDQADQDGDGVGDACDNCLAVANGRGVGGGASPRFTGNQLDSDGDGFGNACDGDFNQALSVIGFPDLAQMRQAIGKNRDSNDCLNDDGSPGGPCAEFDLDGNLSVIGFPDLARFRGMIGRERGPKCTACPLPNLP